MDEASIEIAAAPDVVYDLVADISDMGRWSPETYRTAWLGGATEARAGARFKGWNRASVYGVPARWTTTSVVRRADRGKAFSFDVPFSGTRWTYRFQATTTGCTVTETREVIAEPVLARIMDVAFGRVRTGQLVAGMAITLGRLRDAAEQLAPSTGRTSAS